MEMAKKHCETQAFRMQNGQKTLRNAGVSHAKWPKSLAKRKRFACPTATSCLGSVLALAHALAGWLAGQPASQLAARKNIFLLNFKSTTTSPSSQLGGPTHPKTEGGPQAAVKR